MSISLADFRAKSPFLSGVRTKMREMRYSPRSEEAYIHWHARFFGWTQFKRPEEITAADATAFLSHLTVTCNVAPATQAQAFNALLFLFVRVLEKPFDNINAKRATRRTHAPGFLSKPELRRLFDELSGEYKVLAQLGYGTGMRLMELLRLRIKDCDIGNGLIAVRDSKGGKDRTVPLPKSLSRAIHAQIEIVRSVHQKDRLDGYGSVWLPHLLDKKCNPTDFCWQYLWPSRSICRDSGIARRHHLFETGFQAALRDAGKRAKIDKRVHPHVLRHSFATHALESGWTIQKLQAALGHKDPKTTMIYLHCADMTSQPTPIDCLCEH